MDQTQTHPETLLSTDEQVIAVSSETSHERLNAQPPTCGTQPAGGSDVRHSARPAAPDVRHSANQRLDRHN
ncbi:unnamed protein product [Nesidiocoris tenuis]|uniref:Uncharacterized protein n=1 Tax=Nesidiocoris tenuis TaxID=355587 RepID=A0A6H5HM96_9HEMI|nr:unnamed protein product [Nesidiocoris tenuis]